MAPRGRGRPKKNRNTRMDGAIEAMTKEYGFSDEQLIRNVAKQLLQEYGGEDGWYFIEQYSYRELLDALLRHQSETEAEKTEKMADLREGLNDQDNPAAGESLIENCSNEGEKDEEHALTDVAGPSCVNAEATCTYVVDYGLEISNQDDNKCSPPVNKDGSWKDIVLDQALSHRELETEACCEKDEKLNSYGSEGVDKSSKDTPFSPSLLKISTPPTIHEFPSKTRKPCYGWIESDEEEGGSDHVFIELTPSVKWEDFKPVKRRSKWDLRPDDP